MFLGHDWNWWLPIFTIVSAVFSIAAGTLAIFQDHHTKDGKLTRFGWTLAALIIVSGAASLGLGVLDRIIGDQKEHAESVERGGQFQSQMGELRGLAASLERVQTDMRGSLAEQRRLSGGVDRNLAMNENMQRQAQADTLSVLRRVFQEGNRVAAERIAISVSFVCRQPDEDSDRPRLQSANLFLRYGDNPSISLASNQQLQIGADSIFHGFSGDLGRFESFDAWRNASVSIVLRANVPEAADGYRMEQMMRLDELNRQRGGRPPRPAICSAGVRLLLNGRQVLVTEKFFRHTGNSAYVAEMLNLRVDPNRLPRF